MWDTNRIPSGFLTVQARGKSLISVTKGEILGFLSPGPDGRTIFTGQAGRLDIDANPLDRAELRTPAPLDPMIPSSDPAYYLSVGGLTMIDSFGRKVEKPSEGNKGVSVTVLSSTGTRLLTAIGLDEMADTPAGDRNADFSLRTDDFTLDKRFHLVVAAGLLVTIPAANDRLVLRKLDIPAALERAGGDYLVVVSSPTLNIREGSRLEHQIVARSKRGGLACALVHGPKGMTVSPDGKIEWQVPTGLSGEDVKAEIAVKDAANRQQTHRLQICVN
jgi:hypothetical protein